MLKKLTLLVLLSGLSLVACTGGGSESDDPPTATLAPILSQTPRFTATPVATKTPLPTFTYTPSITPIPPTPTLSPTPSATPATLGIIASVQTVNVRSGPGATFNAIDALVPGTGVEVVQQDPDGRWYNIKYQNKDGFTLEGWVSSSLVRLQPSPTPFPTLTPSPDPTLLFSGTSLPTALFGGGTVTPTPPLSVVTPTARVISVVTPTPGSALPVVSPAASDTPAIPVIDLTSINLTATALSAGIRTPTLPPSATVSGAAPLDSTPAPVTPGGSASTQQGVNIFALCDNPALRLPPPANLAAGSTIVVYWAWFAREEAQIQEHLSASTYEVRVDGRLLTNIHQYRSRITKPGNDYVVYWYVPFAEPLAAGEHRITYRVTWSRTITDGYENFGPGTHNLVEEGSCTFRVQ